MGFSSQEHWRGWPCPASGDLPDPGIEPAFLKSPALAGGLFTTTVTWETPRSLAVTSFCLPSGSDSKESAYNVGDPGSTHGSGRSPGEGNATHSSILAWRMPWTEEPGAVQSMGF